MKVLIVDDDEISLELLEHTLRKGGYEVVTATNGQEALGILRRGSCRLVVADWDMPEMSGVDLCRAVRREDLPASVYTILLTSRTSSQAIDEGTSAGADEFVLKPFNAAELTVRVRAGARILSLEMP